MSKELVCPFCGKPLQPTHRIEDEYFCENYDCSQTSLTWVGTSSLWKALADTKKKLDIRKKQVEIANKAFDFINTEWDNVDCSRKELGACAFNAKEDIAGWESDVETALEQKDVK